MKQDEKAVQSKNKIMGAAMALFLEKGYDETTMQDIVHASAMSKGAIYHYFTSKQEILSCMTEHETQAFSAYLRALREQAGLTARQKLEKILDYFFSNDALPALTKEKWAEKLPFALLDTLRNSLNVVSPCLEEILRQGNEAGEFCCPCPRELAGVLVLLVDLWLDPGIAACSYHEMCGKVDFIVLLTEKFDTPIFSEALRQRMKEGLKRYYEDI